MNRGFKVYFVEAFKAAKQALKRKGAYLKYYLYLFANLFGRLFVIPSLAYNLSDVRMAKTIARDKEIIITKAFKSSDKPNAHWTIFMVGLIKIGMYIGGILGIAMCALILGVFGFGIGVILGSKAPVTIGLLFAAPGIIPLIGYIIISPFYLAPAYYVADTVEGVGPSKLMFKSVEAMKTTGKRTLAALFLSTIGIKILYLVISFLLFMLIYNGGKTVNGMLFSRGFAIVVLSLLLAFMVIFFPFLTIIHRVGNALLYEDIVIDQYNESKRVKGIYIQNFKTTKIDASDIPTNITRMFDEQEDVEINIKKKEVEEDKFASARKKKNESSNEKESLKDKISSLIKKKEEKPQKEEPVEIKENNEEPKLETDTNAVEDEVKEEKLETPVEETSPANEEKAVEELKVVEDASVDETPVVETPVEEPPVVETPIEETPVVETPIEETPVVETPIEETPVEEPKEKEASPAEETPVEESLVEEETSVEDTKETTDVEENEE